MLDTSAWFWSPSHRFGLGRIISVLVEEVIIRGTTLPARNL
jgi:hypothetical protein